MTTPLLFSTTGRRWLLALLWVAASARAWAQAPAWTLGTTSTQNTGYSGVRAVATDASGNVFVTGFLSGSMTFGSTVLTSSANNDLFVAKYVPATGTWAWAQRGGGYSTDEGHGIAVSGNSVYVVGTIANTTTNDYNVKFGGTTPANSPVQLNGLSTTVSLDLVLLKYTDNGSSATLGWVQLAGGSSEDEGFGVAASGPSVYVTGYSKNTSTNDVSVTFGGTGLTPGSVPQYGASPSFGTDLLVAKYTDNGATATFNWSQVGGGAGNDYGYGIAVSGSSVYVAGSATNNLASANAVVFGGAGTVAGTTPVRGASTALSKDLVLAKYTDNGSSATVQWVQVGGGTAADEAHAVALSGSSVYLTGYLTNTLANASNVVLGGAGLVPGTVAQSGASTTSSPDVLLAKYTDAGPTATLGWAQVGGGTADDMGRSLVANGTGVYLTGTLTNTSTNAQAVLFGGTGLVPGTAPQPGASPSSSLDLLVARYTDNGPTATLGWTQVGGGAGADLGFGLAATSTTVYVGGYLYPPATVGGFAFNSPVGSALNFLGGFGAVALPTRAAGASPGGPTLFPNPAPGAAATLVGAAPGAAVQVLDALGRRVATATADAAGTAQLALPAGLPGGVYVVRAGSAALRLAVE
jgi:hypothetical protein